MPYQFQFQDSVQESGITFVHRIVDDAGRFHKGVHYDHGTGISVADVDGDGIEDIYFVNQLGASELWKNLGGGKFRNITTEAGVALADRISVTASFADTDNDGDQDLFVTTVRGGNVLFENDGRGRFQDISKSAAWITSAIPRGRSSSITTRTGCWICTCATLAVTRPTRRGEAALTLE